MTKFFESPQAKKEGMRKMERDHGKMASATGYDTVPKGHTGTVYTCPMHDEVRSPTAGICPICNMTLVPESKSATGHQRAAQRPENHAAGAT